MESRSENKRCIERPFPTEKKTISLKKEDQFMQEHGGQGARFIYVFLMWITSWREIKG